MIINSDDSEKSLYLQAVIAEILFIFIFIKLTMYNWGGGLLTTRILGKRVALFLLVDQEYCFGGSAFFPVYTCIKIYVLADPKIVDRKDANASSW